MWPPCPAMWRPTARAARYAFLEKTAAQTGAAVIATAHNADDNLETVLLHLARGCGLNGLTGIRPRWGIVVRPMLKVPRSAVDAYVEALALPYVEDATNADTAYARNRLRHQVLPVLRSINPKVAEAAGQVLMEVSAPVAKVLMGISMLNGEIAMVEEVQQDKLW